MWTLSRNKEKEKKKWKKKKRTNILNPRVVVVGRKFSSSRVIRKKEKKIGDESLV